MTETSREEVYKPVWVARLLRKPKLAAQPGYSRCDVMAECVQCRNNQDD